jgi:hypothetical protein
VRDIPTETSMDDVNALDLAFGWLNAYAIASVISSALSSSLSGFKVLYSGWDGSSTVWATN